MVRTVGQRPTGNSDEHSKKDLLSIAYCTRIHRKKTIYLTRVTHKEVLTEGQWQ